MRKDLLAVLVAGAIAVTSVTAAGAASRTTAPDATVNLKITLTDKSARIDGKSAWSTLLELPRGTYGRLFITNRGKAPHHFAVPNLPRGPKVTVAPGKRVVVVADFLSRGDYKWAVDAGKIHRGVFRIF